MSNVPRAREILEQVVDSAYIDRRSRHELQRAIGLLIREQPARRAPAKHPTLTEKIRRQVRTLAHRQLTGA
jgi:hypothetical protein